MSSQEPIWIVIDYLRCSGCRKCIACSLFHEKGICARAKTGPFKGAIGDNSDYELQAYLGTNLSIFTPEETVYLASLIDDLGLCGNLQGCYGVGNRNKGMV